MLKRLVKICIITVIGISLTVSFVPFNMSLADTDEVRWSAILLPDDSESGKWTLAGGADTKHLTVASDGTLYCYADPDSTTNRLFKSSDGGLSWSPVGAVKDVITVITTVPNDPATVYYATSSVVYRSSDAGTTFIALPPNPGGAGSNNVQITALAVTRIGSSNLVAVGTRDSDFGNYGDVYLLDESSASAVWQKTSIGAHNVYNLAFSPDYTSDGLLVAVTANNTDTVIRCKIGDAGWAQVFGDACIPSVVPVSARVSFPPDYTSVSGFFLALNTGIDHGDVFRINPQYTPTPSIISALNVGLIEGLSSIDISSLACFSDTMSIALIAGCARQAKTYVSFDRGLHWMRSQESPVGQSDTCVVAASSSGQQKVYSVTCGDGSAFSVSLDNGMTWSKTSLIDCQITSLVDLAVMPTAQAPDIFLITHDSTSLKYHLWRSSDNGKQWQNLFSSDLPGNSFHLVEVTSDGTLCLAGQKDGSPVIWISKDMGQTFISYPTPCPVDAWAFVDAGIFFIGGYDGSGSVIYRTDNGGVFYSVSGQAGTRTLTAIALSPGYVSDMMLAAGNTGGQVFISHDGGSSFQPLGQQLPVTAGIGKVSLAFDNNCSRNNIIYASVDTKTTATDNERLFSLTIGNSINWHSLYSSLPENAVISRLAVTSNGGFYAINGQGVVTVDNKGGLLRSLTPISQSAIEITTGGLDETVTLGGLWTGQNHLYSFDMKYNRLMTLDDNLTSPVTLESPQDGMSVTATDASLKWQALKGATEYEWQINDEDSFSSIPAGFNGTTSTTSVQLEALNTNTSYYWRVRAIKPFHSPWSTEQSFITVISGASDTPELSFPATGAIVGVSPVFLWNTVSGADHYELLVSDTAAFNAPVICCVGEQALPTNAWQCDIKLEYDTNYFWRVRACTSVNCGEWSLVDIFTTEKSPATTVQSTAVVNHEQSSDPSTSSHTETSPQQALANNTTTQLAVPDWVLYVGLALLIVVILLLAILIVVLVASRRLRKE